MTVTELREKGVSNLCITKDLKRVFERVHKNKEPVPEDVYGISCKGFLLDYDTHVFQGHVPILQNSSVEVRRTSSGSQYIIKLRVKDTVVCESDIRSEARGPEVFENVMDIFINQTCSAPFLKDTFTVYGISDPCNIDVAIERLKKKYDKLKTLDNISIKGAKKKIEDLKVFGNGDLFQTILKVSTETEGWTKSTKAMEIEGAGCLVQVTTQQGDNIAEALQWIPGVCIGVDTQGHKCLKVLDAVASLQRDIVHSFKSMSEQIDKLE